MSISSFSILANIEGVLLKAYSFIIIPAFGNLTYFKFGHEQKAYAPIVDTSEPLSKKI